METVYAIDAHIAEFIHTQETGTITSAEYEAAEGIEAASIITSARESRDKNV